MAKDRSWKLVLRCYACDRRFAVHGLTVDRLAIVAEIAPCPHCSARPTIVPATDTTQENQLHRIIDLSEEAGPIYRKDPGDDTWHFSEECSKWPTDKYDERETPPGGQLCNECKSKPDGD